MTPIPPKDTPDPPPSAAVPAARLAGYGLIVLGGLAVLFMTMHPTAGTHDPAEFIERVGHGVPGNTFVHGALIAVVLLMTACFLWLGDVLGPGRVLVRAGIVAQVAGTAGTVAAGLVNGFIVPKLAGRFVGAGADVIETLTPVLTLARETNAACARFGMVGVSMAAVAWSICIMGAGGWRRWAGMLGLLCGLAPLGMHAAEHLRMDVAGFGLFVRIHAVWAVLAGVVMIRSVPGRARDAMIT